MHEPQETDDREETEGTVFLVNAEDNKDAKWDCASFRHPWTWIKAPTDWEPGHEPPEAPSQIDAMVVFTTRYEERACRALCENIRRRPALRDVPLLVAVNQYQMPLANRVKELPNADFIFTPIREEDLRERVQRLAPGTA